MSLDVYLIHKELTTDTQHTGIFIRKDGQIREISRAEWDEKFPGREPFIAQTTNEVFWRNITHNLGRMADKAGLYQYLWRPEEVQVTKAGQLIVPLRQGLFRLENDPEYYKQFNASNGWGVYENLVEFVQKYLNACEKFPEAEIRVSR